MLYKKCRICENLMEVNNFHKKRSTKDGYRNECKECVKVIQLKYKESPGFKEKQKEYDKKRYNEKRDQILERKKEYYIENKEYILKKKEEYREIPKNKERNKQYIKKYKVENRDKYYKYRRDHPHVIAWRSILYSTIKRMDTKKSDTTIVELGYSANELKEHLTKQFKSGMNWDNHGEWEIDHIRPVTKFPKDTDIKIVCSLDNLQPLWKRDNLIKSNKYIKIDPS